MASRDSMEMKPEKDLNLAGEKGHLRSSPRLCVVVPVYNHALTVGDVVRGAARWFPVIVVDDGSTDGTAEAVTGAGAIACVRFGVNRGKGAALVAGFDQARALGYTHAITVDADGQHPVEALPVVAAACREEPEALILGVRDLKRAGAPWLRRFSNALSSFWFRMETGLDLADTQSGLRGYPLQTISELRVRSTRYAWELEVMVRACWAGVLLLTRAVGCDYQASTSRLSHFKPVRDFLRIGRLHSVLAMQAWCVPRTLRRLAARTAWEGLSRRDRFWTVWRCYSARGGEAPADGVGRDHGCSAASALARVRCPEATTSRSEVDST